MGDVKALFRRHYLFGGFARGCTKLESDANRCFSGGLIEARRLGIAAAASMVLWGGMPSAGAKDRLISLAGIPLKPFPWIEPCKHIKTIKDLRKLDSYLDETHKGHEELYKQFYEYKKYLDDASAALVLKWDDQEHNRDLLDYWKAQPDSPSARRRIKKLDNLINKNKISIDQAEKEQKTLYDYFLLSAQIVDEDRAYESHISECVKEQREALDPSSYAVGTSKNSPKTSDKPTEQASAGPTQLILEVVDQGRKEVVTLSWSKDTYSVVKRERNGVDVADAKAALYKTTSPIKITTALTAKASLDQALPAPWTLVMGVIPHEKIGTKCGPTSQSCSVTRGPNPRGPGWAAGEAFEAWICKAPDACGDPVATIDIDWRLPTDKQAK